MKFTFYHIFFLFLTIYLILYLKNNNNITESMINTQETPKYVFSFTTSPLRISKIQPFIDSLMNQTLPPFKIYANLPHVFKRDNSTFGHLPDFIITNPKIVVNWCEDIGPSTKIIPTAKLLSKTDPHLPIISVDDDTYYSPEHAHVFFEASKKYPNTIITGSSFIIDHSKQKLLLPSDINKFFFAQLLEGFAGVMYRPNMFNDYDITTIKDLPKFCYLADDLTLSNYVISKNIPILCIDTRQLVSQFQYGFLTDALHHLPEDQEQKDLGVPDTGNLVNYRNCISWLKEKNQLHLDYDTIPPYLKHSN